MRMIFLHPFVRSPWTSALYRRLSALASQAEPRPGPDDNSRQPVTGRRAIAPYWVEEARHDPIPIPDVRTWFDKRGGAPDPWFGRAGCAGEKQPVVIELFQSQGCSLLPARARGSRSGGRAPGRHRAQFRGHLLGLSAAGKISTPTRATPSRQWDYARAAGRGNVSTPPTGRRRTTGNCGRSQGRGRFGHRARMPAEFGPVIRSRASKVAIGDGHVGRPSTVWLVDYDPRAMSRVAIRAGENGGRDPAAIAISSNG